MQTKQKGNRQERKANRLPGPVEREDMIAMKARLPANSTIETWVFYDNQIEPRIEYL